METKTYTTIDWHELEDLAKSHFKIEYDYTAEEELGNDSNQTYHVEQKDIDEFDWMEWAKFLEGERAWRVYLLITRLVMIGVIPAGDILVEVSW